MRLGIAAMFVSSFVVTSASSQTPAAELITVVDAPPTNVHNAYYVGNREPLGPAVLLKLPIGDIEPKGWLRGQLELMRDGMTGHLDEVSHWVKPEDNAWLSKDGKGKNGWEELPYWLKGVGDLGYVLKDERLTALAKRWCNGVMAAQREDGYFGSEENRTGGPENLQLGVAGKLKGPDLWPQMPMLDALKSYYEMTEAGGKPDERVLAFLGRYFKWELALPTEQLLPASWQKLRGGDNLESVLWLYNRTGEAWLLELAKKLHQNTSPWKDKIASWHGVNFCQGFREPAIWSIVSKDPADFAATVRNYREMMGIYGQVPGGMFGADENCRKGYVGPRQGAETCSMVEYMNSFEQLARLTGDGLWADRCEEVAFNSLPAAFSADYKALHYLTSPNSVQLDKDNKAPGIANDGTMISYDPGEVYRCCQHNHAMGWPYYAEHLWTATPDNGVAALMYSECQVRAKVGSGREVTLTESTDYPFDPRVTIEVATGAPERFPIYLRIPGWCPKAEISIKTTDGRTISGSHAVGAVGEDAHGKFFKLDRTWSNGERIAVSFGSTIETRTWAANGDSISVKWGPLWYSLKIGERTQSYGEDAKWKGQELYATTPWNYGILPETIHMVPGAVSKLSAQPWTPETVPVSLQVMAKRIAAWGQDRTGLVGEVQKSPVKSDAAIESVTLIPMGAARLRISAFPVIGEGPSANEWKPIPPSRHASSYEHDDINALSDGKEPKNSGDHSIPRFTWWSHKGTSEWVTYKFDGARKISSCDVYWFDDTGVGACRVPASWKLQFRDGDTWKDVEAAEYPLKTDQFCHAQFAPVVTKELRLQVQLKPEFSGGILEWKVGKSKAGT